MAKTQDEHQQDIARLFVEAGRAQFMVLKMKQMVTDEQSKLNTLNQKIETAQKAYSAFLAKNPPEVNLKAPEATETAPEAATAPTTEPTDALTPTEAVPA